MRTSKYTPEELKVRKREYQRKYRQEHLEKYRESNRASYHRRKAGETTKRGPKPGTKYKKEPSQPPDTRTCTVCKRDLPVDKFNTRDGRRTHSTICLDCRPKYPPKPKEPVKERPVKVTPKPPVSTEKGCKLRCAHYPCFCGIDNLETDFSLTCQSFKPR